MKNMVIRKIKEKDYDRILELNEELVHFLSPMTRQRLKQILKQSEISNVIEAEGRVEAFILALRQGKDYDSVNYTWFLNNYKEFLYIDRVVVSTQMMGKGLGNMLYQDVLSHAKETGVPYVTAEIDIKPPNSKSLSFHKKFGFKEVETQRVGEGKIVSLKVLEIN